MTSYGGMRRNPDDIMPLFITHVLCYAPTLVYPFVSLRFSYRLALLGVMAVTFRALFPCNNKGLFLLSLTYRHSSSFTSSIFNTDLKRFIIFFASSTGHYDY